MVCDPAELLLTNEEVAPHHRVWAKEVPEHHTKEARALIDDLLHAGVISKVSRPVTWFTQGFFVPKSGTHGKLYLVTYYRELNQSLKRPD